MAKTTDQVSEGISAADRIARLLGLFIVKDIEDKEEKALTLVGAGFAAADVGEMLRVGKNYVNVAIHRRKKRAHSSSNRPRRTRKK